MGGAQEIPRKLEFPLLTSCLREEALQRVNVRAFFAEMADFSCRHPYKLSVGIHPEKFKDGCPMTNVGHDQIFRHPRRY